MSDLIDRQTAQRLFRKAISFKEHVGKMMWSTSEVKEWVAEFIEDLPSVEPRKKGKWLRSGSAIFPCECDQCGDTNERNTPFCPHCGVEMRGE